ncbi:MAG: FKBP-type peptidyl-prolyl cis-trans isomerase [Bacteroidota bacterium]
MRKYSVLFLLVLLSCSNEYCRLNADIKYKLLSFDGDDKPIVKGDAVYIDMQCRNGKIPDEWTERLFVADNNESLFEGHLYKFHEGDSMELIVDTEYFGSNENRDELVFNMKVKKVHPHDHIGFLPRRLCMQIERARILQYLRANDLIEQESFKELYILEGDRVSYGKGLKRNDPISMHYKTFLLDGKLIASSEVTGPINFKVGEKGQVLEGIENVLSNLVYDERFKLLIPSEFAFGNDGSGKIVPIYTPIIMELTCVKPSYPG